MTYDEAVAAYERKFGGFPWPLMGGWDDEDAVDVIVTALERGEEITVEDVLPGAEPDVAF